MSLFPRQNLSDYSSPDTKNLLEAMDRAYTESITINQSFWTEAEVDTRFREGDSTPQNNLYGTLSNYDNNRRFNFNRCRRVCNMISGHQRRNRKSIVVTPRENSSNKTSAQSTKLMFWAIEETRGLETISDSFDDSLTTGLNLLNVWWDWRQDPISGDPRIDSVAYNAFLIDPFFRKRDLSDCNFIWQRRFLTRQEIVALMPHKADEIESLYSTGYRDGKFQFMPESYQYGIRNLMAHDEYWYRAYRRQALLVEASTGLTLEWKGNKDNLKEFLKENRGVEVIFQQVPTVKLGIVVNGQTLYNGPNPMGIDRYPFVPVFTYFNPDMPYFSLRIQGIIRGLRDAQYLYDRRKVIELDILESRVNSGVKFKEDALVNPKDVFLKGQGANMAIKREASIDDVQQFTPPSVPPSMFQLSEILAKEIQEISGVNEELLGSADDDKSGILSMLRQGAGLTTLQILYDHLDFSQKMLGNLLLNLMQVNFTPGKVQRIIGETPTEEFYSKVFGKYDAVVEEGLNTSTQRQLQFAQLLHLGEMGHPVPIKLLVENSTFSDKEQVIEAIQEEQQQQSKIEQEKAQMDIALLKAQIERLEAASVADSGLGIERASRVKENQALSYERMAEAERDLQAADLDQIKAIKELQSMDLDNLMKNLQILQSLHAEKVAQTKTPVADQVTPPSLQQATEQTAQPAGVP